MLSKIISVLLVVTSTTVKADWFDATWFDGIVQIPITVDEARGSLWLADLVVWNTKTNHYIVGGYCSLDNNGAQTIIFSPEMLDHHAGWFTDSDADCSSTETVHVTEDGDEFEGLACRQKLCVGSWIVSLWDDQHTQVCNDNQYFVYA